MEVLSFAWRGPRGSGKRTMLLQFLEKHAIAQNMTFTIKSSTWYLNKSPAQGTGSDSDDDETSGKSIPYEESPFHLGFDVARMSMSDKVFLQSILNRWTGQQDVCLTRTNLTMRYLVLYHAHYLTDESVLQLQETLEQFPGFAILMTTELPVCGRLRDYCFEIPVPGKDRLLGNYTDSAHIQGEDVWRGFFMRAANEWSREQTLKTITDVRHWIYVCLQRNLRWTDVIMYWIEAIYGLDWIYPQSRKRLFDILWRAESGSGWVLVSSYRIPILWEHVHLELAKAFYEIRSCSKE